MEPPSAGAARFPLARCLVIQDVERDDGFLCGDGRSEGRVIACAQVVTKPYNDRFQRYEPLVDTFERTVRPLRRIS